MLYIRHIGLTRLGTDDGAADLNGSAMPPTFLEIEKIASGSSLKPSQAARKSKKSFAGAAWGQPKPPGVARNSPERPQSVPSQAEVCTGGTKSHIDSVLGLPWREDYRREVN